MSHASLARRVFGVAAGVLFRLCGLDRFPEGRCGLAAVMFLDLLLHRELAAATMPLIGWFLAFVNAAPSSPPRRDSRLPGGGGARHHRSRAPHDRRYDPYDDAAAAAARRRRRETVTVLPPAPELSSSADASTPEAAGTTLHARIDELPSTTIVLVSPEITTTSEEITSASLSPPVVLPLTAENIRKATFATTLHATDDDGDYDDENSTIHGKSVSAKSEFETATAASVIMPVSPRGGGGGGGGGGGDSLYSQELVPTAASSPRNSNELDDGADRMNLYGDEATQHHILAPLEGIGTAKPPASPVADPPPPENFPSIPDEAIQAGAEQEEVAAVVELDNDGGGGGGSGGDGDGDGDNGIDAPYQISEPASSVDDAASTVRSFELDGTYQELCRRAEAYRQRGAADWRRMEALEAARKKAILRGSSGVAFGLKFEIQQLREDVDRAHRRAARLYYKARNFQRAAEGGEIDVHYLKKDEALAMTERELRKVQLLGGTHLRVIVGKGIHSRGRVPVLKPYIRDQMQSQGIRAAEDPYNSGVLDIRLT